MTQCVYLWLRIKREALHSKRVNLKGLIEEQSTQEKKKTHRTANEGKHVACVLRCDFTLYWHGDGLSRLYVPTD